MFLALREIRHAKLRFALITGVIVMVSSLVFILSRSPTASARATPRHERLPIDGMVVQRRQDYCYDRSSVPAERRRRSPYRRRRLGRALGVSSANITAKGSGTVIGVSFFGIVPDR